MTLIWEPKFSHRHKDAVLFDILCWAAYVTRRRRNCDSQCIEKSWTWNDIISVNSIYISRGSRGTSRRVKTLQLYVWRDKVLFKEVLDRAKEDGFTSLVLTADFFWVGNRERDKRTGFWVPPTYSYHQCIDALKTLAWTYDFVSRVPYGYKAIPDANFPAESLVDFIASQMKPAFDWMDAEWLCQEWGDIGPVALKGVASAKDAQRALETGFNSTWVSNHGGRLL